MARHTVSYKTRLIAILLGIVLISGVVSLFRQVDDVDSPPAEEFQFVEIAPPPPPPPPPTDEPEPEPEQTEAPLESLDAPADLDPSIEPSGPDLGIDLGDLALGLEGTGGFLMEVPRFGLRGSGGAGGDGDLLGSGNGAEPPVPTLKPQPAYPNSLLRRNVSGRVVVSMVVNADGSVASVTVKTSSGHQELDEAALSAARKWKFKPGTRAGKPAKSTCNVPFNFEVKKS